MVRRSICESSPSQADISGSLVAMVTSLPSTITGRMPRRCAYSALITAVTAFRSIFSGSMW